MYQEFQGCSKTCQRTPRFLGSRIRTLVLNTIVSCRFILFHFIQSSSLCFWPNRLPVVIPKRLMIEVLVLSLTRRILKWANSFLAPSPQPAGRGAGRMQSNSSHCPSPTLTWSSHQAAAAALCPLLPAVNYPLPAPPQKGAPG